MLNLSQMAPSVAIVQDHASCPAGVASCWWGEALWLLLTGRGESGVGGGAGQRGKMDRHVFDLGARVQELRRATKRLAGAPMWHLGERIPERLVEQSVDMSAICRRARRSFRRRSTKTKQACPDSADAVHRQCCRDAHCDATTSPRPSINEVTNHAVAMQRQVPRNQLSAKTVEVPPHQNLSERISELTQTVDGTRPWPQTSEASREVNSERISERILEQIVDQCRRFWNQPLRPSTCPFPRFSTTSRSSSLCRHTPMIHRVLHSVGPHLGLAGLGRAG